MTDLNPFDTYAKRLPGEPVFVLLGRDPMASSTIIRYANMLSFFDNTEGANAAVELSNEMIDWRLDNPEPKGGYPDPEPNGTAYEKARHWIDRYASGIDAEPQMGRIAAALYSSLETKGDAEK